MGITPLEIKGLQSHKLRPSPPVPHCRENPDGIRGAVAFILKPLERLDGQQIERPVVGVLPDRRVEPLKSVGGVAPLVVGDDTPV